MSGWPGGSGYAAAARAGQLAAQYYEHRQVLGLPESGRHRHQMLRQAGGMKLCLGRNKIPFRILIRISESGY